MQLIKKKNIIGGSEVRNLAITQEERKAFENVLEKVKSDPEEAAVVLKVLFNFLKKVTSIQVELQSEAYHLLENHQYFKQNPVILEDLKRCWDIVAEMAQEGDVVRIYTTGQLAKFFGVSITTINKWISAGRFVGVERTERNKQARISELAFWISPTGEKVQVQEIVDRFIQKQSFQSTELDDQQYKVERVKHIASTVSFYENRYGGSYQTVIKQKGDPYLTEDWMWGREGKEWHSLIKEIAKL